MPSDIYWLTHDLRMDDNRALVQAAASNRLLILYVVDPSLFDVRRYGLNRMSAKRWRFLVEGLQSLDEQLSKLGQRLYITIDQAQQALPKLATQLNSDYVYCSAPLGYDEKQTLAHIAAKIPKTAIRAVQTFTLFEQNQGNWLHSELGNTFSIFRRQAEKHTPLEPVAAPSALPPPQASVPTLLSVHELIERLPISTQLSTLLVLGGEAAGLNHLSAYFDSNFPASYKDTRNSLDGWSSSAKLSSWLSTGCISVRRAKHQIDRYESTQIQNESTYWLYFELLWREYFQWSAKKLGADLFHRGGHTKKPLLSSFYPERFQKWCRGQTPWPLVNAAMRELFETGLISNRARQIVASCLVNELGIDWHYGAA